MNDFDCGAKMSSAKEVRAISSLRPGPGDAGMRNQLLDVSNACAFVRTTTETSQWLGERWARVEQPFSGIHPTERAHAFDGIALDRPLVSFAEALAELDRLFLRDAIYFHHPRYLAHLNCPVVYPAVGAELIAATVNSSVDTWDQSAGAQ
jgi:L-2,4-diaminobutyrate decarboxylase